MAEQDIQFKNKNYLPLLNATSWSKYNGAYVNDDGNMVLPKGSHISYDISDFKNMQFKYFKLSLVASSNSFSTKSSLSSDVSVELIFNYLGADNSISNTETCVSNISTVSPINSSVNNQYSDTKILDTMNLSIYSSKIKVTNNMDSDLILFSIKLYTSDDMNESQFINTINKYIEQNRITGGVFGVNKTGELLRYIKAYLNLSDNYIKFSPFYEGNKLIQISISNGLDLKFTYEIAEDEV